MKGYPIVLDEFLPAPKVRETCGTKARIRLIDITERIEKIAQDLDFKLDPIVMQPGDKSCDTRGLPVSEPWPPYFASLRESMERIEIALDKIDTCLLGIEL